MLDTNQMEAVRFYKGPCLCLAGPGSGKTTVLVNRIKNLIEEYNVPPEKILVITFTKAAAIEMRNRFNNITKSKYFVDFGTFHSVFFNILKEEIKMDSSSILFGDTLVGFLKEVIKDLCLNFFDDEIINSIYSEISFVNNSDIDINNYESKELDINDFRRIYIRYNEMKTEFNKLDFDDMLLITKNLFERNVRILKKWQERFLFYMIDEMQDMNKVQFDIINKLAREKNIFAVGDDDQSIYGFRGANPKLMLEFPQIYKETKIIKLSNNYRSAKRIVELSKNLISNNEIRFQKSINAVRNEVGSFAVELFDSEVSEAEWIVQNISKEKGISTAILYRNKSEKNIVISMLNKNGIKYYTKDKGVDIYKHWIFKDIMAYISISINGINRKDFVRIYNKPNRYINREALNNDNLSFDDIYNYYSSKSYMIERINELKFDINKLKNLMPCALVIYIRKKIGYDKYIEEYSKGNSKIYKEYFDILERIIYIARGYSSIIDFYNDSIMNMNREIKDVDVEEEKVFLYTFHASKGLEFDEVFILDCNEGVTPSKKAKNNKELEEERRMFYVALTRAKDKLTICYLKKRNEERCFPSRFIREIKEADD